MRHANDRTIEFARAVSREFADALDGTPKTMPSERRSPETEGSTYDVNDDLHIAVDAESGTRGRTAWVAAVAAGSTTREPDRTVYFTVAGDEPRLTDQLARFGHNPERIRIRDTSPASAPSPLEATCTAVADGEADAAVTARPPRLAADVARRCLRRLEPVRRPVATAPFAQPGASGDTDRALLLDAGAADEASADDLVQFAEMGACYAESFELKDDPRIALLSNGDSVETAPERIARAAEMLQTDDSVEFAGLHPSSGLVRPEVDVFATDGFSGRLVLDLLGEISALAADLGDVNSGNRSIWRSGLAFLSRRSNADEENAAPSSPGASPILGLDGSLVLTAPDAGRAEFIEAFGIAVDCVSLDLPARLADRLA